MAKAIRIHAPGDANALSYDTIAKPHAQAGELLLKQSAIGVNYIDVYHRMGMYPLAQYPAVLGMEACGYVQEIGEGVEGFAIGDRVAYGGGPVGAYATFRTIPAHYCAKVPDGVTDAVAASSIVQGLTAHFLLRRTFVVRPGITCLVHAAAGGVGTLLCEWAKHLGATVIGTVSTEEKAKHARANGCDHVIISTKEDIAKRVREITHGEGVAVVYDSIGKDTFMASLDSLRTFGLLVSYGQASGPVPPFDIGLLAAKGSLYMTRPSYMNYTQDNAEYHRAVQDIFALIAKGVLKVHIGQRYKLSDAAQAHKDLEARRTRGATVLKTHY